MANGSGRGVVVQIWKNFWASITQKKVLAEQVGKDHLGNKYFEVPADPSRGKRRPVRWFEPHIKDKLDQEVPVEWEAWLQYRRKDVPTKEEIEQNLAIIAMKQQRAPLLEEAARKEREERTGGALTSVTQQEAGSFPRYKEYKSHALEQDDDDCMSPTGDHGPDPRQMPPKT